MNTVGQVHERIVSGLSQPMSDSTFIAEYSKERNMGFHTAVGTATQTEKNTIRACVHPLLGDTVYGSSKNPFHLQGQTLHAMVLGFVHPVTGEYMEFTAPLPDYFLKLLEKLRK